jgi:nucleotide-binding universal stress UspA family protein
MKALVAYRDADDGPEALTLGATLRESTGADLVVVAVLPPTSEHPGIARVDLEYRTWLDKVAEGARERAAAYLSPDDPSKLDFRRITSTSVAAGLVEAAGELDADVLVLGSARLATKKSFLVGSVGERLLHSSPVPLMLAPDGYERDPGDTFGNLTCAYAGTDRSREALAAACDLAVRYEVELRVATFVPRAEPMYPPEVGLDAEDMVSAQWAEQAVALHDDAREFCAAHGVPDVATVVGRGSGWSGALHSIPWGEHDVLVFGSSRLGQVARVFLGSTASKIMRYSPVPVLVVPCGTVTWSS